MNAKKAKKIRRRARQLTQHLPEHCYREEGKQSKLGECTRGAYQALKSGRVRVAIE
jgi:hypothetical protein